MKTLITGACKLNNEQIETLKKIGLEIIFLQNEKDEIDFGEFEFVICNGLFLYHDIKIFKKLKYIQLTSAGLDRIPMGYINEHCIKVFNARGVYSIPMAEWTVLKILELYKNSKKFIKQQEQHIWDKERDIFELYSKTVAIIGMGSVGFEIAKRLKCFGTKIISVDMSLKKDDCIDESYILEDLDDVLKKSDIVILTLPLTEETVYFFNNSKFEKMKKESVIVNISRGKIINTDDMIKCLDSGKLLGAILDVFEEEPLSVDSRLWDYKNVIITPHNSFVGEFNNRRLFEVIEKNVKKEILSE